MVLLYHRYCYNIIVASLLSLQIVYDIIEGRVRAGRPSGLGGGGAVLRLRLERAGGLVRVVIVIVITVVVIVLLLIVVAIVTIINCSSTSSNNDNINNGSSSNDYAQSPY